MNLSPFCYKISSSHGITGKISHGYIQQHLWLLEQIPSLCMNVCHYRAWTVAGGIESMKGGNPDVKWDSLVYKGGIVLLGLSSAQRWSEPSETRAFLPWPSKLPASI